MAGKEWLSVGQFMNRIDADLTSRRLAIEEIPNRVAWLGLRSAPKYSIEVPPERLEEAVRVLSESAIPEDELTELALREPPPDDD